MAPLGRVTYFRYVVGPRPSARDRSAGDSSPVTPRAVGFRGRPGPTASAPNSCSLSTPHDVRTRASPLRDSTARGRHHRCAAGPVVRIRPPVRTAGGPSPRRNPPAPRLGTGDALTPVPIAKGPADSASGGALALRPGRGPGHGVHLSCASRSGLVDQTCSISSRPSARSASHTPVVARRRRAATKRNPPAASATAAADAVSSTVEPVDASPPSAVPPPVAAEPSAVPPVDCAESPPVEPPVEPPVVVDPPEAPPGRRRVTRVTANGQAVMALSGQQPRWDALSPRHPCAAP